MATKIVTDSKYLAPIVTASNLLTKPTRGVPAGDGMGRKVPVPKSIKDEDMLSGDEQRTIGWTCVTVQLTKDGKGVLVSDATATALADPKASEVVKDAQVLTDARAAVTAAPIATQLVAVAEKEAKTK